MGQYNIDFVGC